MIVVLIIILWTIFHSLPAWPGSDFLPPPAHIKATCLKIMHDHETVVLLKLTGSRSVCWNLGK